MKHAPIYSVAMAIALAVSGAALAGPGGGGGKGMSGGGMSGGGMSGGMDRAGGYRSDTAMQQDRDREQYRGPEAERDTRKAKSKQLGEVRGEGEQARERLYGED